MCTLPELEDYTLKERHLFAYKIARDIIKGKVLDIGCNTGQRTKILIKENTEAYGIDIDENRLLIASSFFSVIISDALHIPFKDNTFDYIIVVN